MISEPYKSLSSDGCDNVVVNPSGAGQFAYLECAAINPAGILQQFLRCKNEISLAAGWAHSRSVSALSLLSFPGSGLEFGPGLGAQPPRDGALPINVKAAGEPGTPAHFLAFVRF